VWEKRIVELRGKEMAETEKRRKLQERRVILEGKGCLEKLIEKANESVAEAEERGGRE